MERPAVKDAESLSPSDDTDVVKERDSNDVEDKTSGTAPEQPSTSDKDRVQKEKEENAEISDSDTDCLESLSPSDDTKDVKGSDSNDFEDKTSATPPEDPRASDKGSVHDDKVEDAETSDSDTDSFKSLPPSDDTEVLKVSDINDFEDKTSTTSPEDPRASDKGSVHDDKETKPAHSTQPTKPTHVDVGSDFIHLGWLGPLSEGVVYYEIKYKVTRDKMWNRKSMTTEDNSPQIYVGGLQQETGYTFKVRAQYTDEEGEFSEPSDSIHTMQSPALSIRNDCIKLQDGEPAIYKLPLHEHEEAKSKKYKTRKCEFGSSSPLQGLTEKTIMMIGATGSGKSTLIDGMVNHLLGVKWKDDFRFKIIDLMTDEEARKGSQSESQTDWITSYRVHPMNKNVKLICNIIDTPGFGDTRGIERDHELVSQIRAFFSTKGVQGIETIDAICFVTQAPLARLTFTQQYIYESILSIFGKDMKENIVAMITFADGKEPPVLTALIQAEVPIKQHFLFNNSALFEQNTEEKCNKFGRMFWDMGSLSYGGFFDELPLMRKQSLQLTAEVLLKREQLNVAIEGLVPQINIGLGNLETIRQERALLDKFSGEIADNKNFVYEVDEFRQYKINLEPGKYVTNCTFCHFTCHYPCGIADDYKACCWAMTNGKCRVCPGNCAWDMHRNNDFRIDVLQVKVKKTYEEMKTKFEIAEKGKVSKERICKGILKQFHSVKNAVYYTIKQVRKLGNYLRQNAIRSNPLTEIEYIDVLIESLERQKSSGFQSRVTMLKLFRRNAEIKAKSTEMSTEDLMKELGFQDMVL